MLKLVFSNRNYSEEIELTFDGERFDYPNTIIKRPSGGWFIQKDGRGYTLVTQFTAEVERAIVSHNSKRTLRTSRVNNTIKRYKMSACERILNAASNLKEAYEYSKTCNNLDEFDIKAIEILKTLIEFSREINTLFEEQCRAQAEAEAQAKRKDAIDTLSKMGYSVDELMEMLKSIK